MDYGRKSFILFYEYTSIKQFLCNWKLNSAVFMTFYRSVAKLIFWFSFDPRKKHIIWSNVPHFGFENTSNIDINHTANVFPMQNVPNHISQGSHLECWIIPSSVLTCGLSFHTILCVRYSGVLILFKALSPMTKISFPISLLFRPIKIEHINHIN